MEKLRIRMVPFFVNEEEDSVAVTSGKNTVRYSKEDYGKKFGNCLSSDTLIISLKSCYNVTRSSLNKLIATPTEDEDEATIKMKARIPEIKEELERIRRTIEILRTYGDRSAEKQ